MRSVRGIQHIERSRASIKATRVWTALLPTEFHSGVVAPLFPTPDRMPRILPSPPVKKSVLRQLGINELPHGLAHLKHNLLLSPSHTPSQGSNICTNIGLSWTSDGMLKLLERVYDTIAESGPDPDIDNESKKKTFKSMYYLDQIAIVCLAAGLRACQAPDCLHYRRKLERVVPVCHSWPGLRDWVLCIKSCSLRAKGETLFVLGEKSKQDLLALKEYESRYGLVNRNDTLCGIIDRLIVHLHALILLTAPPGVGVDWDWTLGDILEPETLEDESGSIGGPRPDQTVYSDVKLFVSSKRCPRFTPEFLTCRRGKLTLPITITLHQCVGLTFICKHLILYKRKALQIYQLMLLRFSS